MNIILTSIELLRKRIRRPACQSDCRILPICASGISNAARTIAIRSCRYIELTLFYATEVRAMASARSGPFLGIAKADSPLNTPGLGVSGFWPFLSRCKGGRGTDPASSNALSPLAGLCASSLRAAAGTAEDPGRCSFPCILCRICRL